ncbi:hypothetical protein HY02_03855 [Peptococcaceae bacterium SCADC1_2_3]|nr:hypothetical protein HY02_03855 [Peptococcaceae bacterium SCADC1_2_3]
MLAPEGSHRKGRNGLSGQSAAYRIIQSWLPGGAHLPEGNLIIKARFTCAIVRRTYVPPELSPAGPVSALSREHPGKVKGEHYLVSSYIRWFCLAIPV